MRLLTPTWAIWCNANTPKLRWNRGELELNYRGYMWAYYNFNVCTYLCCDIEGFPYDMQICKRM